MTTATILKLALVAGAAYAANQVYLKQKTKKTENIEEKCKDKAKPILKQVLLDEDEKRQLKHKSDELRRKYCNKSGLCEPPPPKTWEESLSDAWYDTWQALKKIPGYWSGFFKKLGDSFCRFFKGGSDE